MKKGTRLYNLVPFFALIDIKRLNKKRVDEISRLLNSLNNSLFNSESFL